MELRSPLNSSSPKTHLGAASCYRLRPRSDAVSESAALLRSSHRLSSPRRNPLFERDVRSNRRSNSLYLAATLGRLRCLWGQRLFNTLVPTLLDDDWSYGNSYNPANCSNQNRKRLETIGRLGWFNLQLLWSATCSVWPKRKKKLCSVPPNKDEVKSNDQSHIRGLFKGQFWF